MKVLQTYRNTHEFAQAFKTVLPKPREAWRLLTAPMLGEITGIHTIRGKAIATNGILVAVVREDNELFFGHLEWFKEDPTQHAAPKAIMRRYNKDIIREYA